MRSFNQVRHSRLPYGLILLLGTVYLQAALWAYLINPVKVDAIVAFIIGCSILGIGVIWFTEPRWLSSLWLSQAVTPASDYYQQTMARLCQRGALPVPALMQVERLSSLAYAAGSRPQRTLIGMDESFLREMKQPEVEAILAHELGHIALGHTSQLTLFHGAMLPVFLPIAALVAAGMGILQRAWAVTTFRIILMLLPYVLLPLTSLLLMVMMRRWEYAADRFAVQLVGKPAVLATLRCLHGVFMPESSWNQMTAFDERRIRCVTRPFTTHPSIPQRITALWRQ